MGAQQSVAIIPTPASLQMGKGYFTWNAGTQVRAEAGTDTVLLFLNQYLQQHGKHTLAIVKGKTKQPVIHITQQGSALLPADGYRLSITPDSITLTGKAAGLFYGMQSLLQLLPVKIEEQLRLPCLTIEDHPRFGYRGLMLDVSRHFFTVDQIKELLNWMAYYKLNRFHWHLTDDQGWRLEIKRYPKLTQTGAWRVPRIEFGGNTKPPQPGEKATDGGFYTQDQVRDIIRYAAERHIEVLPEIDVPGHSMAAIAAYPELCVTRDTTIKVNPGSGFAKWFKGGFEMYVDNTLNPINEQVYRFLDGVFTEVAALFPSQYIHIGGDECYKGFWEKDSSVQLFMRQHQLPNAHALQAYFISRLNKIIQSKGKKLIGWDEILQGEVNEQVAVMNRFGEKGAITQTRKGLDIVLAPGGNGFYFDYAQSTSDMEPSSHGGNAPLWKSFVFNPEYAALSEADKKHILGVEACIWTEHIPSTSKLYYMALPRLLGLAETGWAMQARKSYASFVKSVLPAHLERFDQVGLNYRVPTATAYSDTTIRDTAFTLIAEPPLPEAKVYFTVNGIHPSEADHLYLGPVALSVPKGKKMVIKTVVITPSGKRSVITKAVLDADARQTTGAKVPAEVPDGAP